jgi:vacuolar-type H+-ATPase subunit E/Vma4
VNGNGTCSTPGSEHVADEKLVTQWGQATYDRIEGLMAPIVTAHHAALKNKHEAEALLAEQQRAKYKAQAAAKRAQERAQLEEERLKQKQESEKVEQQVKQQFWNS